MRVLYEAAADHVLLIAEADVDLAVRGQQQARVLEAAAGEHVSARPRGQPLAGERPDLKAQHLAAGLIRGDVDHARVQHERDVVGRVELAAVDLAELGRRAELPDPAHDLRGIERQHLLTGTEPGLGRIVVGAELAELLRFAVVGLELGLAERPAGERDPRPALEVELVQRPAAPGPMVGRAAEEAQPADLEVEIGQPDVGAAIEVLDLLLVLEPAALQQADLEPAAGERAGDRDPGGAGADDAEIAFQQLPVVELACVLPHVQARAPLLGRAGGSRDRHDHYTRHG